MNKRVISVYSLMAACVLMIPGIVLGAGQGGPPGDPATWTVAMYVGADNDLEMYWDGASLEMLLQLPDSDTVTFVAFVDRLSTDTVELVEISGGTTQVVAEYDEMNTGDGETFGFFLGAVASMYAADHTAVVIWDHGSAWRGFCVDQTSGGDKVSLLEMQEGIESAGVLIDILAFDACACSSIELTYQASLTGLVNKVVASEELVAGDGFPYDSMFGPLAEDSDRTVEQVTEDMLAGWVEYYGAITWAWYCPLTIVDVGSVGSIGAAVTTWSGLMLEALPDLFMDYRVALRDCYYVSCGSHYQPDIVDLARHLLDDPDIVANAALAAATEQLMMAAEAAVDDIYNTETTADCGGISIWWGVNNEGWRYNSELYSTLSFAQDTGWYEFLHAYNTLSSGWYANLG